MSAQLRPEDFPPFFYGLHEAGGEGLMVSAGRPGWVLEMATVGHDPGSVPSGNFTQLVRQGLRVIIRLHHGFGSSGTIPRPEFYPSFAQACATFVARCQGARTWIIGNEPNHEVERPDGQLILPAQYADAYRRCRTAIHKVAGHAADQVLVAGPALWNATTTYAANPKGDWVKYFADILAQLPAGECDGFAIHTYTHYHDPSKIRVDIPHPSPGYHHLRDEFRSYRDLMAAVPARFRQLPVYITEADPTERHRGWGDGRNLGWVRTAYQEIADWNANAAHQPIQALILYRWFRAADQPEWSISDRPGIQEDFRQALRAEAANAYRVRLPQGPPPATPAPPPKPAPAPAPTPGLPPLPNPLPDVRVPLGYTNQHAITAFYRAGLRLIPKQPWALMAKAGIKLNDLAKNRAAAYSGPDLNLLPKLAENERKIVRWELSRLYHPATRGAGQPVPDGNAWQGFLRLRPELDEIPLAPPDELRIDPVHTGGAVERKVIRVWNSYGWLLMTLADLLGIEVAVAVALAAVNTESPGFDEQGRMAIRFENNLFFDYWGEGNAEAFGQHFRFDARKPSIGHEFRPSPDAPWQACHESPDSEWGAFSAACALDDTAAKLSAAMGAPRLMGFLYGVIGHVSVDQMVLDCASGEDRQIIALFDLIAGPAASSRRLQALCSLDFVSFSALHSGVDRAAATSGPLRSSYAAFRELGPIS